MEKTPLVISFGGTLRGMSYERVTAADLVDAIFFLGCHRQHVVSTNAALEQVGHHRVSKDRARELHQQFLAAFEDAEQRGRVAWHNRNEFNGWEQLNNFLEGLGLPTIVPVDHDHPKRGRYCYPSVDEAVRVQELPYQVIWV